MGQKSEGSLDEVGRRQLANATRELARMRAERDRFLLLSTDLAGALRRGAWTATEAVDLEARLERLLIASARPTASQWVTVRMAGGRFEVWLACEDGSFLPAGVLSIEFRRDAAEALGRRLADVLGFEFLPEVDA